MAGVATTSTGNCWSTPRAAARTPRWARRASTSTAVARLFEFDKAGKFLREIGSSNDDNRPYDFLFAQGVRVDPQNNIWVVDRASRMVVKFDQSGRVLLTLGRRPEAIGELGSSAGVASSAARPDLRDLASPATISTSRPTWPGTLPATSSSPDGYGNARVAKFDKNGKFIKSWGSTGAEPGQFNIPHSVAVDATGNVYVADMGNQRIQVFDNDGTFKSEIKNVGAPRAICISPGAHQFLYSSNSNPTEDPFLNGEIYKMELDGTVLGTYRPRRQAVQGIRHGQRNRLPRSQHLVRRRAHELASAKAHPALTEPASPATQERRGPRLQT